MFAKMVFTTRAHAKLLTTFITSLVFLATALPALAQQQEAVHVIRVWHPFMIGSIIVGTIFVVLAIIGVMVIFVWLVRWATRGYPFYERGTHYHPGRERAALDILDERFARGEIDKAEYEEKRKLLGR